MKADVTNKQRQAMEFLQRSKAEGMTLSAYSRSRGIKVRVIYDGLVALRRKGLLPRGRSKSRKPSSAFVAVRVSPSTPELSSSLPPAVGAICRVRIGSHAIMECAQWPPASWLAALMGQGTDAAS
jgi:hypothetical protein